MGNRLLPHKQANRIIKLLGWMWVIISVIIITIMGIAQNNYSLQQLFPKQDFGIYILGAVFFIIFSKFHFVIGKAIENRKKWGRMFGILLGIIYLPLIYPGISILWLLIKDWNTIYEKDIADEIADEREEFTDMELEELQYIELEGLTEEQELVRLEMIATFENEPELIRRQRQEKTLETLRVLAPGACQPIHVGLEIHEPSMIKSYGRTGLVSCWASVSKDYFLIMRFPGPEEWDVTSFEADTIARFEIHADKVIKYPLNSIRYFSVKEVGIFQFLAHGKLTGRDVQLKFYGFTSVFGIEADTISFRMTDKDYHKVGKFWEYFAQEVNQRNR